MIRRSISWHSNGVGDEGLVNMAKPADGTPWTYTKSKICIERRLHKDGLISWSNAVVLYRNSEK